MSPGCRAELGGVILYGVAVAVFASLSQHPVLIVALGLFGYLCWTLWSLRRFLAWLSRRGERAPTLVGAWGDAIDMVQSSQRSSRREIDRLILSVRDSRDSLAALSDGVLILGAQGDIGWCNPAATTLLGLRYPEDVGQAFSNLVRDPDLGNYLAEGDFERPLELNVSTRPARTLELRIAEFGQANKIVFVRDVTAIRRMETIRREFVANVSHELRTPLTVISGYLETLMAVAIEPRDICTKALGQMQQQVRRMSILIRDLMVLDSMESDQPDRQQTDMIALRPLLDSVCEGALATAAGTRELKLDCQADLNFRANRPQLESIFANLVVNAVKYTRDGGRIQVNCRRTQNGIEFEVIDDGIGIDPKHIPRLTERFYRVDQSRSIERGGSGLGLAIVKHALRNCGGELHIQSLPGKGSTFRCRLPRLECAVSPAA